MAELVARTLALQIVTDVRAVVDAVEKRDRSLNDQMRRAAVSVISNINEGARRKGKDRLHFWRISAGSADELMGQVHTAVIWGYVPAQPALLKLLDRFLGVAFGLTEAAASRAKPRGDQ